jgi:hypothetical protein
MTDRVGFASKPEIRNHPEKTNSQSKKEFSFRFEFRSLGLVRIAGFGFRVSGTDCGGNMGGRLAVLAVLAVGLAAGCRAPAPCRRPAPAEPAAPVPELPLTKPVVAAAFELDNLPKVLVRFTAANSVPYRELSEPLCQSLAARNASAANALDDENRMPATAGGCDAEADRLRREVRHYAALESRNQAAEAALDRYFQIADAEVRSAVAREGGPILDALFKKAREAKDAKVRYPLDPDDVDLQRGQLAGQLDQADAGVRAMNVDLRRRLGLSPDPADERLWPVVRSGIDPGPADASRSVNAALADRPELRAWRALQQGLNADTLPVARDLLGGAAPLAAGASGSGMLARCLAKLNLRRSKADPCADAELEVRRKQLADLIASRERDVADEVRVAVVALDSQTRRVAFARDRVDRWREKLDEAERQLKAGVPLADLQEAQVRLEWLKARAELVAEVMAWHRARVRLKAAMGWLVWETLTDPWCPGERGV